MDHKAPTLRAIRATERAPLAVSAVDVLTLLVGCVVIFRSLLASAVSKRHFLVLDQTS
jgi:hypothetical protein